MNVSAVHGVVVDARGQRGPGGIEGRRSWPRVAISGGAVAGLHGDDVGEPRTCGLCRDVGKEIQLKAVRWGGGEGIVEEALLERLSSARGRLDGGKGRRDAGGTGTKST